MKDIMQKLAELEATAPKAKKMLTEDTVSPIIEETKARTLKNVFQELSETATQPFAILDPQNKQSGVGVLKSNNPAVDKVLQALNPKEVQVVQTTTQGQQPAQTTPAPAGATGQPVQGQQPMREKDEGKPGKNFAKIAKSAGERYGSKAAGERVAGAIRAKLAKQGKLEEEGMEEDKWSDEMEQWALNKGRKNTGGKSSLERAADRDKDWALSHRKSDTVKEEQLDELSPETIKSAQLKRYGQLNQLAQTGAARAGSTTSFNAKASPQSINQFHDTEVKAINRDFNDQQRTSAKYDPAERDAALASNERNRARNMSRGNMLNLANKKLQGTANVPAKSVAEGAKVDRMVKHIEKSERKLGKSKDKAEDIAWATANKRGMLDNKNKKKVKEADIPSTQGIDTQGAGLGAGRSPTTLEGKTMSNFKEGKWNYPKDMTQIRQTSDMGTTNAQDNRDRRREFRKKEKAKAHAELMKGNKKVNEAGEAKTYFAILDPKLIDQIAMMNGTEVEPNENPPTVASYDGNTVRQLLAFAQKYPDRLKKTQVLHRGLAEPAMAQPVGGNYGNYEYNLKEGNKKAKPDFLDMDKDGNKKESMKKAVADKKKKTVKEGMSHRIAAARFEGKSHGLRGHAYHGKAYEDIEEMKAYHDGFKEGLDECYGMGVYETAPAMPASTVPGMASQAMEDNYSLTAPTLNNPGKGVTTRISPTKPAAPAAASGPWVYTSLQSAGRVHDMHSPEDASELISSGLLTPNSKVITYPKDKPNGIAMVAKDVPGIASMFGTMDEGKLGKAALALGGAAALAGAGGMAKGAYDYHKKDPATHMSQYDVDKMTGRDFTREDEFDEGNLFTGKLATTKHGGKFSLGGKTFTDRSNYDATLGEGDFAFESWSNQLNELLNEGLSVSVSKGQQNSPDSVTITAQDAEADQLLQLVKHAGLGLFGDDHAEPSQAMSIQPTTGEPDEVGAGGADIEVVDGSDDMLSLMQKLGGISGSDDEDYADEEGHGDELHGDEGHDEDTNEANCNECGMMETECQCDKEQVEEVESEDQQEFEVAEDNAPDSDEAETSADEEAEAEEDKALATKSMNESFTDILARLNALSEGSGDEPKHPEHDKKDDKDYDDAEEEVTESEELDEDEVDADATEDLNEWANQVGPGEGKGTDASFEEDIEFMTKVIAGGLNKPKSTGQTTVPVIPGQFDRMHDHQGSVSDTVDDWTKLAGIK